MTKFIILDRDGVINEDSDAYIKKPAEWLAIPGSLQAIAKLNTAGYCVIVATNQSGIGRGYYNRETLEAIHNKMHTALAAENGQVDAIYYCPHTPDDDCNCRKPKPGLLQQALKHYAITPEETYVVGDSWRDLEAGLSMQFKVALVRTGKGEKTFAQHTQQLKHIAVFDNLAEFVDQLLAE